MSDSNAEDLPLDIERQLETLDQNAGFDLGGFLDALPASFPEECPDCPARLSAAAVYVDAAGEATLVRLVCHGSHEGRVASYLFEVDRNELFFEHEQEPITFADDFEHDRGVGGDT